MQTEKNEWQKKSRTEKPRLFVDLSAVHDIDPEMASLPDTKLITIDDFEKIARSNNEQKKNELPFAERILDSELDSLYKELSFHRFFLKHRERLTNNPGFLGFLYKFRDTSTSDEFDSFLCVMERAVKNGDSFPVF